MTQVAALFLAVACNPLVHHGILAMRLGYLTNSGKRLSRPVEFTHISAVLSEFLESILYVASQRSHGESVSDVACN